LTVQYPKRNFTVESYVKWPIAAVKRAEKSVNLRGIGVIGTKKQMKWAVTYSAQ